MSWLRSTSVARVQRLRTFVWDVVSVRASKYGSISSYWPSFVFEAFIVTLITLNIVAVVVDTTFKDDGATGQGVNEPKGWAHFMNALEIFSTTLFTTEYAVRLWACVEDPAIGRRGPVRGRLWWAMKPLSLVDLIALVPFYMDIVAGNFGSARGNHSYGSATQVLKAARLLRMVTILRIERQTKGLRRLKYVLSVKRAELIITMYVTLLLLLLSSTLMYFCEEQTPQRGGYNFTSIPAAMWWSVNTLTTVGYGDMVPQTTTGKVLAAVVQLIGIILFALPAGIISSGLIEVMYDESYSKASRKLKREQLQRHTHNH